jgi:hypothetical protein
LASSESFNSRTGSASNYKRPLPVQGRFRGHRGGLIGMHRSMSRLELQPRDVIKSVVLALLFLVVWVISLPRLCRFWQYILDRGITLVPIHAGLGLSEHHVTRYIQFFIPYPRMQPIAPDAQTWAWTAIVVAALFAASFFLPPTQMPLRYLLRIVGFIQGTALLYFLWEPARFPHTPDSYLEGLVTYGIAMISFVPILFSFTYYIMNFSLLQKAFLTVVAMTHLTLFLPLLILLQAMVLQKSVLFMPLLYIVFGLPVEVLMIIAFYSWGMSWPSKDEPLT